AVLLEKEIERECGNQIGKLDQQNFVIIFQGDSSVN
ncbi:unnamed protein product, partial [Heterotrigona itama]